MTYSGLPQPDKILSFSEIKEISIRANDGDPEAIKFIFSRIARYVEPSPMIPEEFLLYFSHKAIKLDKHNDISVLTQSHQRTPGRVQIFFDVARMVVYLMEKYELSKIKACKQVAEDTKLTIANVEGHCDQWPGRLRKEYNESPFKHLENTEDWRQKIHCDDDYQRACNNVLNGKDTPYLMHDMRLKGL